LVVTEDGKVVPEGPLDKLINLLGGGWKGAEWQKELNENKDFGWDKLFEASRRAKEKK
jgi:hypothetical protein